MTENFNQMTNETIWRIKFVRFFRRMKEGPFWQAELLALAFAMMWFRVSMVSVWKNAPPVFDFRSMFVFYKTALVQAEIFVQTLVAVSCFTLGWMMVVSVRAVAPKLKLPRLSFYRLPFVGRIRF